jgi:hypothetical protein
VRTIDDVRLDGKRVTGEKVTVGFMGREYEVSLDHWRGYMGIVEVLHGSVNSVDGTTWIDILHTRGCEFDGASEYVEILEELGVNEAGARAVLEALYRDGMLEL